MALGKIKADTLEHSTAGSVDTQYVVKSIPKAFFQADLEAGGGPVVEQSINISSITDVQSGQHDFTYTSSFAQRTYACVTGGGGSIANNTLANVSTSTAGKLTSKVRADTQYVHTTAFDPSECAIASIGDLA